LDHLPVAEGAMFELDACALGEVGGRPGQRHELGQPRDVIGLQMRLEHGDDRDALTLRRAM
jgi:hypothetical protein